MADDVFELFLNVALALIRMLWRFLQGEGVPAPWVYWSVGSVFVIVTLWSVLSSWVSTIREWESNRQGSISKTQLEHINIPENNEDLNSPGHK